MKVYYTFTYIFICFALKVFGQQNELYLEAGSLYDSERNTIVKNRVIHIVDNRIVSVGGPDIIPENAEIIDLSEYTVLPGFIDAHTHVLFSQEPQDDFAEHSISTLTLENPALRTLRGDKRARSYLDAGFTSIKELGNSGLFLDEALRDANNEGTIDGPRIYASGPILAAAGGQLYGVSHSHQELVSLEL